MGIYTLLMSVPVPRTLRSALAAVALTGLVTASGAGSRTLVTSPFTGTTPQALSNEVDRSAFVTVTGHRMSLRGETFRYAGWNTYYLMVYSAQANLRPNVLEVFDEADAMGLSVLRTWAFNDGAGQWNALQTAPGVYDEDVFVGLDYVVHQAGLRGIKLVLTLVNNWDDYGGMNQYVAWSPTAGSHDDFYTDALCRQWYRDHVATVTGRVNTFTGLAYRDDPTILGWGLANEPRCSSDGSGATLQSWIAEMAAHVKAVDPNHLVTTGSEGFYGPASASGNPRGWMTGQGVDFLQHHLVPQVDFATIHTWPDHWGLTLRETVAWVARHGADAEFLLAKPLVVEEFGKSGPLKDLFFQAVYDEAYVSTAGGGAIAGTHFWHLLHDAYAPFDDGFGVLYPADATTIGIIQAEAARILALP
jgi:mannan endo-1,4-beta-mannosidase